MSLEDLEQEGMIALIKSIDRHDPAKGIEFSSFAYIHVRSAIARLFRNKFDHNRIPSNYSCQD